MGGGVAALMAHMVHADPDVRKLVWPERALTTDEGEPRVRLWQGGLREEACLFWRRRTQTP